MDIALYTLTSSLHNEESVNALSNQFITEIENKLGFTFNFCGTDFTTYGDRDLDIIYVRTGGTESIFKKMLPSLKGKILLLTSGESNSLAASMEILAYLKQHNLNGEIIHGSTDYIAERIMLLYQINNARRLLQGKNIGVIGRPSDWLIASNIDKKSIKDKLGINIIEIPVEELINSVQSDNLSPLFDDKAAIISDEIPQNLKQYKKGALDIYCALKKIIADYSLYGLTIRCFDLLESVNNTSCLALAMLNEEGIPSGCEGDIPSLLTMVIIKALTGHSGFQANPSRIDPLNGEMVFAHCTIPFDMVHSYSFNTHFESSIGIAVHGELDLGEATVFKVSGDLNNYFCCKGVLTENPYEKSLCRSQVRIKFTDNKTAICRDYFLKSPIGNHHIILTGDYYELFDSFMSDINN